MNKNKRGNVLVIFLCFSLIFIIFILFNVYVLYEQVDLQVYSVKNDMFYIVQNSIFSLDKSELKYYNYKVNESTLLEKINKIIYLNYNGRVNVYYVSYDYEKNNVNIKYGIDFYPVVFKNIIGEKIRINLVDNIKLKNMEV